MANPYGWGANEPVIEPVADGGDTIAVYAQKIYSALDEIINTLNTFPWAKATNSSAGYMSAADKTFLDSLMGVAPYSNTVNYAAGSIVTYSGAPYVAVAANGPGSTLAAPTNTTYWHTLRDAATIDATSIIEKFPSGVMLQSGVSVDAAIDSSGRTQLQFPEAFIEPPYIVALARSRTQRYDIQALSKTSCSLYVTNRAGTLLGTSDTAQYLWIALGRWY